MNLLFHTCKLQIGYFIIIYSKQISYSHSSFSFPYMQLIDCKLYNKKPSSLHEQLQQKQIDYDILDMERASNFLNRIHIKEKMESIYKP